MGHGYIWANTALLYCVFFLFYTTVHIDSLSTSDETPLFQWQQ